MNPTQAMRREAERAMRSLRQAFRAVLTGLNLSTRIQRASGTGLSGEDLPDVELFQHFGFTSAPPVGTQYIVVPLGGRTSASVVVASEHGAYRLKLDATGEMAIYNQWGDHVHLKKDRSIHVAAQLKVVLDTPLVQVNGEIRSTGNITSDAEICDQGGLKSMSGMRQVFNEHDHNETDVVTLLPNSEM